MQRRRGPGRIKVLEIVDGIARVEEEGYRQKRLWPVSWLESDFALSQDQSWDE